MSARKVAVIGAGAAGQLAAAEAALCGADVVVFERNTMTGRKLRITGKGRCNVTNDCEPSEFIKNVTRNGRFLYSAVNSFSPADTMALFESLGVPLKTERGRRVFPQSDRAGDIAAALEKYARQNGVKYINERVRGLKFSPDKAAVTGLATNISEYNFDAVVIASGGLSYPKTGSDGDGYKFARSAGHTIIPASPSLVPVDTVDDVSALEGLSLRNVTLTVTETQSGRNVFTELGEMLFTATGLSGPLVLSASAHMQPFERGFYTASVDLKPALDYNALDRRLLADIEKYINRDFINGLSDLLPHKLIPYVVERSGIPEHEKLNSLTAEQRHTLAARLKSLDFGIASFRPVDEAIITRGGVDTREIEPKTMKSRLVDGLYFAGEVIDVDAYTGGYNLQIAFSTGAAAGRSQF